MCICACVFVRWFGWEGREGGKTNNVSRFPTLEQYNGKNTHTSLMEASH